MKEILMKVTSRDRPETLLNTVKEYVKLAENTKDMYWLFSFDLDDQKYNDMQFQLDLMESINGNGMIYWGYSKNKIEAINAGVNGFPFEWDILLNISDDQLPVVKGYDNIIREQMTDLDLSLWFSDGRQNKINTQEIVGRKYYERFNYIYHPFYKSFFCDNEATEVGAVLGKIKRVNKCIIKHYHPAWDKNSHLKVDDLYKRNDQYWNHDQELYNARKSQGFTI